MGSANYRVRRLLTCAAALALPDFAHGQLTSWTFSGSGASWVQTWTVGENWNTGLSPNVSGAEVIFPSQPVIDRPGTVVVDQGVTANMLRFRFGGFNGYTVQGGGSINFAGDGTIDVMSN